MCSNLNRATAIPMRLHVRLCAGLSVFAVHLTTDGQDGWIDEQANGLADEYGWMDAG